MYTARWSPQNTLSYVMAKAIRLLRSEATCPQILLTYVNPNVGFDGASYRAANWTLYGLERGTRYAYLDSVYVTDRELTAQFGTSDAGMLTELLGDHIAFSIMNLRPLEMYGYALDHRLRRIAPNGPPREWHRPWA